MLGFCKGLSDMALVAMGAFSREMFPSMVTARQGRSGRSKLGMVRWLLNLHRLRLFGCLRSQVAQNLEFSVLSHIS